MSNWSKEKLQTDLASSDFSTHQNALRELARWMTAEDPLKREFAAKISSEAIIKTVDTAEAASAQVRRKQIMDTFWAAHEGDGLVRNQANENQLFTFVYNNTGNQLSLDTLEQAVEALGSSLSRNPVAPPPLSVDQALDVKIRGAAMRDSWLRNLSVEDLKKVAKEEERQKRQGKDPLKQFQFTAEEKLALDSRPKPSTTKTRLWNPETNPIREYTAQELKHLSAQAIRRLICTPGGLNVQAQTRFNEILAGATPEVQA